MLLRVLWAIILVENVKKNKTSVFILNLKNQIIEIIQGHQVKVKRQAWTKQSLLNCVPYVPACQRGLRANVQKTCQLLIFTCQRAKWCANFSTRRANVPKGIPIFQAFLLGNAKWNFYTLLLHRKFYILLDIVVIHIICICVVNKNCIILHFHTSCHIKEKCQEFFLFIIFFFFAL